MYKQRAKKPPEERFWPKVRKLRSGCWKWTAGISAAGYGVFNAPIGGGYAHRFSYILHKGPILDGLEIDHLCRHRWCVNPDHLEAVSRLVNVRRGAKGPTSHCPRGHPRNAENTYFRPDKKGIMCRVCARERNRRQPKPPYDPAKRRAEYLRMKERQRNGSANKKRM